MAFLKKKNCAKTTLSGAMTAGQTTMTVADASVFPSSGDFLVTIWNKSSFADPCNDSNMEIVKVTNVSGNLLTITRAQESTTGVTHSSGHAVEQLITAGTFEELETAIDGKAPTSHTHTEADITDLGAYIENIVEDTTPELGGELDAGENTIGFTLKDNATTTIDWRTSNKQSKDVTGSVSLTFTNPSNPCNLLLVLTQSASGGTTMTWPANVKWPGGTEPTLSITDGAIDIISFFFDGTDYYGVASLDFS